jgi:hypothetical protein
MRNVRTFIALVVAVASVVTVTNALGQSASTSDSVIDFGAVAVGESGNDIVTVTNVSNFDIIISATVGVDPLAPTSFSTDWSGFVLLPSGGSADVNVYFNPAIEGDASDVLVIDVLVNDDFPNPPSEEQATVDLFGTGGISDDPCDLITDILNFFDDAVANGTLEGTGNHCSARRVRAMRNRLRAVRFLVCRGYFCQAAYVNRSAILRSDGENWPKDFVQGPDRAFFNEQLELLQILLE